MEIMCYKLSIDMIPRRKNKYVCERIKTYLL